MNMDFGTLERKTVILWVSGVVLILILRFVVLADRSPALLPECTCAGVHMRR